MSHIIKIEIVLNITTHSLRPFSSSFSHLIFFFFSPIFLNPLLSSPSNSFFFSPSLSLLFSPFLPLPFLRSFDLSHRACLSSSRYTASSLLALLFILTYRLVMRLKSVSCLIYVIFVGCCEREEASYTLFIPATQIRTHTRTLLN